MKSLAITRIRIDGGTQPRESIDSAVVEDYAELMKAGTKFPPADIYYDGKDYWLADGFHRRAAYLAADIDQMPVEIHQGTQRDAQWHSFGANKHHGLHRDRGDASRAIRAILADEQWAKTPQAKIAAHVGVNQSVVSRIKADLMTSHKIPHTSSPEVTRGGKTFQMNTSKIGRAATAQSQRGQQDKEGSRWIGLPNDIQTKVKSGEISVGRANAIFDRTAAHPANDDEIDPETNKPYPPVPDGNIFEEAKNAPELRANKLVCAMRGSLIAFRDHGILRDLKKCDPSTRRETIKSLQSVLHSLNELVNEMESYDEANENENRPARRKTG